MLHTIGKKKQADDVVDLLTECHDRIRAFLSLAEAAARKPDVPPEEIVDACERVERYFTLALPLHVRDEEDSVLPRLCGASVELARALDAMRAEHALHEASVRRLVAACAALGVHPLDRLARSELDGAVVELRALFEPHLEAEERVVFPAIRTALTKDERAAIVRELRARRRLEREQDQ